MSVTKKYLFHTALLTILVGGVGGLVYFLFFPCHYFGSYPLISFFYFSFGVLMINLTENCHRRMPERMLQVYLLVRIMRMLASIIVMIVYCLAVREGTREFLLAFIVNYLIYLIYDSWFYFAFEANRKLNKEKTT